MASPPPSRISGVGRFADPVSIRSLSAPPAYDGAAPFPKPMPPLFKTRTPSTMAVELQIEEGLVHELMRILNCVDLDALQGKVAEFQQSVAHGRDMSFERFRVIISKHWALHHRHLADNTAFVHRLFELFDKNKDGRLDFAEFHLMLARLSNGSLGSRLSFAFQCIDVHDTGRIHKPATYQFLRGFFCHAARWSPEGIMGRVGEFLSQGGEAEATRSEGGRQGLQRVGRVFSRMIARKVIQRVDNLFVAEEDEGGGGRGNGNGNGPPDPLPRHDGQAGAAEAAPGAPGALPPRPTPLCSSSTGCGPPLLDTSRRRRRLESLDLDGFVRALKTQSVVTRRSSDFRDWRESLRLFMGPSGQTYSIPEHNRLIFAPRALKKKRFPPTVPPTGWEGAGESGRGSPGRPGAPPVVLDPSSGHNSDLGIDIGGSLSKLVFFEAEGAPPSNMLSMICGDNRYGSTGVRDEHLSFECTNLAGVRGRFHFIHFHTERMKEAFAFIKMKGAHEGTQYIHVAGGGATKYSEMAERDLNIQFIPMDEIGTIIKALAFLMSMEEAQEMYSLENVSFGHEKLLRRVARPATSELPLFPFLLVNIGSGVSIVRVESMNVYERVSGTALGGGTFWGLCRLLSQAQGFDEAMEYAEDGHSNRVNMTVGDIYGGKAYGKEGLDADMTAAFFGKMTMKEEVPGDDVSAQDMTKALIIMISQNVTQIAYLNARLYGVKRIVFTGNFLRHNNIALRTLSYSMDRWSKLSKLKLEALYLAHEGYLGALGALLANYKA